MFVHMLVTNPAFQWSFIRDNAFSAPVINGAKNTLVLTVLSMVAGVLLGILLAVMRLSPNPVLSGGAWVYVWFFRAVPRVVLLILFGNLGVLYAQYDIGIPFDRQIADLFGLSFDGRFFGSAPTRSSPAFVAALLGLALSEAAYMAEIVRAGISSIDEGQTEAAQALGMSRGRLMRRIVLPQAMRVIVPPTGNETIAMIKDTSLVAFVPYYELFFQLQSIGARTFQLFPMLVAACLWYLAMTSVLMVGQHYLEKRYAPRHPAQHRPGRAYVAAAAPGCGGRARAVPDGRRSRRPAQVMVKAEAVRKRFGRLEVLKGIDLEVLPRRGDVHRRARPARASPPSCAASTTWRRSTAAGCGSTASWSATGRRASKLYELKDKEVAAHRRDIGMVFQRFNLFPHMTALENVIEAPVQVRGESQAEARRARRSSCWSGWGSRRRDIYPAQLSGGQQQRVAIARALAMEPS